MDHSCHQCGQSVEDGRPFCLHCGAPQIRVNVPEPLPTAPADPRTMPLADDATNPGFSGMPSHSMPAWPLAARPSALAAGVAVLLMFLGLNPFVTALGVGFLAVALSRRLGAETTMPAALGFKLGALGGLFLFAVSTVVESLAVVLLHKGADVRSQIMEKVQEAAARYPGPEVQPFLDFARSPGGFTFLLAASLIFGLVTFVALGGLGGAIGAALLGRRDRS